MTDAARILVFGDHRRAIWLDPWRYAAWCQGGEAGRRAVLERISSEPADLILHTGDLVPWASPRSWHVVDKDLDVLRGAGAVVDAVAGNHETYGWIPRSSRAATRMPRFLARFPRIGGARWGRRDVGTVRILLLDSNERVLTADEKLAQESWLASEVAAADADVKVDILMACWHHPPFTNTTKYGDDRFSARSFLPRLRVSRKLAAVFCGHVHGYERFWAESVQWIVSGGGGARAHRFPSDHSRWRHTPAFDASALSHLHVVELAIEGAHGTGRTHHFDRRGSPARWVLGDAFEIRPHAR